MQTIRYSDADYRSKLSTLLNRSAFDPEIEKQVAKLLDQVRLGGDAALVELARKFDGVDIQPDEFRLSRKDMQAATGQISSDLRKAIRVACKQIKDFAMQRIPAPWSYPPRKGVIVGERFAPFSRVGAYVPGGTAPLISTVLHTVTLAAAAGVPEIVVVTPPGPDKSIHPALLYAAGYAGATELYRLGGVYAIAALAFGTETVPKVDKIVGPGNAYVTAAKRQVYGYSAIDLVAGPSEIMIIADETANPAHVAADMLSQAEHGSGHEQAVLATTDDSILQRVQEELKKQSQELTRIECVQKVLENGVFLIQTESLEEAAQFANSYAPEHLEVITRRPGTLAKKINAAGAIFLGYWTPEAVGDFLAGPSHVLPTGGAARFFSGLTVEQFFRRMSVINYQKNALVNELEHIQQFAEAEGLDAHGRSAAIRIEKED